MINFNYETEFKLDSEDHISKWISDAISSEDHKLEEINYVFCNDDYLHKLNVEFLNHDTLTDIISFDYSVGKIIQGDIFISIERVTENAQKFNQTFDNELNRVLIHGILHYLGFKDKLKEDKLKMSAEEDKCLKLLDS